MHKGFREFLSYTKAQRRGIVVLFALIVLMQAYYFLFEHIHPKKYSEPILTYLPAKADNSDNKVERKTATEIVLFEFDPNTVSQTGLVQLGLTDKQATTFINYRNKGAVFQKPEDMLKVYSVSDEWFAKVKTYIRIKPKLEKEKRMEASTNRYSFSSFDLNEVSKAQLLKMGLRDFQAHNIIAYREKVSPFFKSADIKKVYGIDSALVKEISPFAMADSITVLANLSLEINKADSTDFAKIPGLRAYQIHKILKYRKALGGYFSLAQLYEIKGMDSSTIYNYKPYFKLESAIELRKLNINEAGFKELLAHPYLDYEMVKNISNYRNQIGDFKSIEELKNIPGMNEVLFGKLAKYTTVE